MNLKRIGLLAFVCAAGLSADVTAGEPRDYARLAFIASGASRKPLSPDEYVTVVVEGPYLSYEQSAIPASGEVEFVDRLLKTKGVSYVAVYARQGIKYGDLVRAMDVLRSTAAKHVGISLTELKPGREP